jgi:opacity protein-like surface antigen
MKRRIKIGSVLLMIALLSGFAAAAVQKPAAQQAGTAGQLVIGAQDVITASDAGGGTLSSRDLIWIILGGVVLVVLILVL